MEKLRDAAREVLENRPVVESMLPFAPFLALLLPALQLINQLHPIGFYTSLYSVFWILYLIGLLLCFAQANDFWIGLSCALRALTNFFGMFSALTLNTVVYLIFYGAFAWYFLRIWSQTPAGVEFLMGIKGRLGIGLSSEDPMAVVTCVRCGAVTSEENSFCPKCGTPLVKKVKSDPPGKCRQCGSRLEPGARFCSKCGRMVEREEPKPPVDSAASASPEIENTVVAASDPETTAS